MRLFIGFLLTFLLAAAPAGAASEDTLRVAPFGKVTVYHQTANPGHVVLFVSGDGGWNKGVVDMARTLAGMDALVAGVDIVRYLHQAEQSEASCFYPAADFENLSKVLQQHYGYGEYVTPILVGYSSGATLVYATLVQAPGTTFKGGISLGFCPDLEFHKPLCKGSGLTWNLLPKGKGYWFLPASNLEVPWIALQGLVDQVCFPDSTIRYVGRVKNGGIVTLPKVGHGYAVYANWMPQFKEAFRKVAQSAGPDSAATRVPELPDLPLEVVEAPGSDGDVLALHVTGDGGWGVTDKGLSQTLAGRGIPVVALNALHYFWKAKTPESTAQDVARVLRHYMAAWKKQKVVLIGYSFGADVLPFVINRLPDDLRGGIRAVAFLGLGSTAEFEFRMTSWIGHSGAASFPVRPEVEKLRGMKILCFHGEKDSDDLCKDLPADLVQSIELSGGHRIGSNFEGIADEVMKAAQ
jgi:type IV secretory pathway VirJ component